MGLVLVVPWDQSSLSVGLPRVWQWYTSMTGDQTISSLVRQQPIHSPEKGMYFSMRWRRPQDLDTRHRCSDLGCVLWKPLLTMYSDGSHYLLMTLLFTLRHRSTVYSLGGYALSCLSRSHGSAVYWSAAMLYIFRAWECPPREDSFISDMNILIYGCRYLPILSSTPLSSS